VQTITNFISIASTPYLPPTVLTFEPETHIKLCLACDPTPSGADLHALSASAVLNAAKRHQPCLMQQPRQPQQQQQQQREQHAPTTLTTQQQQREQHVPTTLTTPHVACVQAGAHRQLHSLQGLFVHAMQPNLRTPAVVGSSAGAAAGAGGGGGGDGGGSRTIMGTDPSPPFTAPAAGLEGCTGKELAGGEDSLIVKASEGGPEQQIPAPPPPSPPPQPPSFLSELCSFAKLLKHPHSSSRKQQQQQQQQAEHRSRQQQGLNSGGSAAATAPGAVGAVGAATLHPTAPLQQQHPTSSNVESLPPAPSTATGAGVAEPTLLRPPPPNTVDLAQGQNFHPPQPTAQLHSAPQDVPLLPVTPSPLSPACRPSQPCSQTWVGEVCVQEEDWWAALANAAPPSSARGALAAVMRPPSR